jgi:gamma-glutamyltranspeptidase/glutathione hydrolase
MSQPIFADRGAITAGHPLAAQAGVRILQAGGNAVDAAVATAAALSVVMPDMIGPFGYGFALIAMAGAAEPVALDMNGVAPRAVDRARFLEALRGPVPGTRARTGPIVRGPLACTVPGALRGWEAMIERHGRLSLAAVLGPAIEYAEEGRPLDPEGALHIRRHVDELGREPSWAELFLVDGAAPAAGHRLVMRGLAATLRRVAAGGADVVYRGELTREIVEFFRARGGWLAADDLAAYRVQWKRPIRSTYRDVVVHGVPPAASSLTWMEALAILEGVDLPALGHNTAPYLHTVIEATKRAYLDTFTHVGDPDFVEVPVETLLGPAHAAAQRERIGPRAWMPPSPRPGARADGTPVGSTTHLNVIDRDGNVVAMTGTLGAFFGGGLVIGRTGLLANDGMDWFDGDLSPWTGGPSPTAVEPGKRPRLTLAPAILYRRGRPWLAIGGAGAEATISGVLQPILNVVDFGMDVQRAIDAPRFRWGDMMYYTLGTQVRLEAGIGEAVRADLAARGHDLVPLADEPHPVVGATNALLRDAASGVIVTGANRRGRDAAAAY